MCLRVSYKKKIWIFFASLSHWKKESDPDSLVRGTDPRIRKKCHGSPTLRMTICAGPVGCLNRVWICSAGCRMSTVSRTGRVSRPKTDLWPRMSDEYPALVECLDRIRICSFRFRTIIWYWVEGLDRIRMGNLLLPIWVLDPKTDLPKCCMYNFAGVRWRGRHPPQHWHTLPLQMATRGQDSEAGVQLFLCISFFLLIEWNTYGCLFIFFISTYFCKPFWYLSLGYRIRSILGRIGSSSESINKAFPKIFVWFIRIESDLKHYGILPIETRTKNRGFGQI